jgi:hypothetical protein
MPEKVDDVVSAGCVDFNLANVSEVVTERPTIAPQLAAWTTRTVRLIVSLASVPCTRKLPLSVSDAKGSGNIHQFTTVARPPSSSTLKIESISDDGEIFGRRIARYANSLG